MRKCYVKNGFETVHNEENHNVLCTIQAHIVDVVRGFQAETCLWFQADRVSALCESRIRPVVVGGGVQEIRIAAEIGEGGVDEARPVRGAPAEEGAEGQGQRQGEEQVS